ncbi:hypothetical protein DL95DRAFT_529489 [Leptodontidium sp. 2 PMI_412]|nr:hypothetical protein DL95DRAFT_529489 [Leptodontidium sp. 2 PMI_412]
MDVDPKKVAQENEEEKAGEETTTLLRLSEPTWVPGPWNRFPTLGIVGFVVVFIGTVAALVILVLSDEQRVTEWPTRSRPVTPNVLVNLATHFSSFGLATAIAQGVAISWWRKVLHGGTLRGLHDDYRFATDPTAALTAGRRFNLIALAAVMTKFGVVDSTLFQKSITTELTYVENFQKANIQAWFTNKWAQGQGGIPGSDGDIETVDQRMADIVTAFNTRIANEKCHDAQILFNGCPPSQSCSGTLDALGFAFACSMSIEQIDYGISRQSKSLLYSLAFDVDWSNESKRYASINLNMSYINSENGANKSCPGTLTKRTCKIRPSVVRYPLLIQAADKSHSINITHLTHFLSQTEDYHFNAELTTEQLDGIKVLNYTDLPEKFGEKSTVGGITFALNSLFKAKAALDIIEGDNWDLEVEGPHAVALFPAENTTEISSACGYKLDRTATGLGDPFIALLRNINSFGFISALYVSEAFLTPPETREAAGFKSYNFTADVSGYVQLYNTQYGFLVAAIAATFFSVVCLLPVYWGYWQLGRRLTLDPFEIAQALRAPLLAEATMGNGYLEETLDQVGDCRIRYGRLVGDNDIYLRIAESDRVMMPQSVDGKAEAGSGEVTTFAGELAIRTAIAGTVAGQS